MTSDPAQTTPNNDRDRALIDAILLDPADFVKVAIAESDVEHYPGLWLRGTGGRGLAATFPPYVLEETLVRDRDLRVARAADSSAPALISSE